MTARLERNKRGGVTVSWDGRWILRYEGIRADIRKVFALLCDWKFSR